MAKTTDFFIAGNSKSGTTALYKFLKQHPQICMSEPKEPNFFAADFCHDQDVGAFTRKSEEEYLGFFDDPTGNKLWGEASACYLYSKTAAQEIYAYKPDAKIIVILREPVSFLHSYHLQMLENVSSEGETEKNFEKALALEEKRRRGEAVPAGCLVPEMLYYSERVRYAAHLQRFLNHFDRSQIKVIIYDDFKDDNAGIVRDVLAFLGFEADFEPVLGTHNRGEKLRSKTMQRLVYDLTHGRDTFAYLKPVLKNILPCRVRKALIRGVYRNLVFKPKPAVDSELRRRLMIQFKPEVEKVSRLLGEDLVRRWQYDMAPTAAPLRQAV